MEILVFAQEFFLAIWKGGGTGDVLLSHFIGVVIGMQSLWMLGVKDEMFSISKLFSHASSS